RLTNTIRFVASAAVLALAVGLTLFTGVPALASASLAVVGIAALTLPEIMIALRGISGQGQGSFVQGTVREVGKVFAGIFKLFQTLAANVRAGEKPAELASRQEQPVGPTTRLGTISRLQDTIDRNNAYNRYLWSVRTIDRTADFRDAVNELAQAVDRREIESDGEILAILASIMAAAYQSRKIPNINATLLPTVLGDPVVTARLGLDKITAADLLARAAAGKTRVRELSINELAAKNEAVKQAAVELMGEPRLQLFAYDPDTGVVAQEAAALNLKDDLARDLHQTLPQLQVAAAPAKIQETAPGKKEAVAEAPAQELRRRLVRRPGLLGFISDLVFNSTWKQRLAMAGMMASLAVVILGGLQVPGFYEAITVLGQRLFPLVQSVVSPIVVVAILALSLPFLATRFWRLVRTPLPKARFRTSLAGMFLLALMTFNITFSSALISGRAYADDTPIENVRVLQTVDGNKTITFFQDSLQQRQLDKVLQALEVFNESMRQSNGNRIVTRTGDLQLAASFGPEFERMIQQAMQHLRQSYQDRNWKKARAQALDILQNQLRPFLLGRGIDLEITGNAKSKKAGRITIGTKPVTVYNIQTIASQEGMVLTSPLLFVPVSTQPAEELAPADTVKTTITTEQAEEGTTLGPAEAGTEVEEADKTAPIDQVQDTVPDQPNLEQPQDIFDELHRAETEQTQPITAIHFGRNLQLQLSTPPVLADAAQDTLKKAEGEADLPANYFSYTDASRRLQLSPFAQRLLNSTIDYSSENNLLAAKFRFTPEYSLSLGMLGNNQPVQDLMTKIFNEDERRRSAPLALFGEFTYSPDFAFLYQTNMPTVEDRFNWHFGGGFQGLVGVYSDFNQVQPYGSADFVAGAGFNWKLDDAKLWFLDLGISGKYSLASYMPTMVLEGRTPTQRGLVVGPQLTLGRTFVDGKVLAFTTSFKAVGPGLFEFNEEGNVADRGKITPYLQAGPVFTTAGGTQFKLYYGLGADNFKFDNTSQTIGFELSVPMDNIGGAVRKIFGGHDYSAAAARQTRLLSLIAGSIGTLAAVAAGFFMPQLTGGNLWASLLVAGLVAVLFALLPFGTALIANRWNAIIKQVMGDDAIARDRGELTGQQVAALSQLRKSGKASERRLYRAILLHESYSSHAWGNWAMNPLLGWLVRFLKSPDQPDRAAEIDAQVGAAESVLQGERGEDLFGRLTRGKYEDKVEAAKELRALVSAGITMDQFLGTLDWLKNRAMAQRQKAYDDAEKLPEEYAPFSSFARELKMTQLQADNAYSMAASSFMAAALLTGNKEIADFVRRVFDDKKADPDFIRGMAEYRLVEIGKEIRLTGFETSANELVGRANAALEWEMKQNQDELRRKSLKDMADHLAALLDSRIKGLLDDKEVKKGFPYLSRLAYYFSRTKYRAARRSLLKLRNAIRRLAKDETLSEEERRQRMEQLAGEGAPLPYVVQNHREARRAQEYQKLWANLKKSIKPGDSKLLTMDAMHTALEGRLIWDALQDRIARQEAGIPREERERAEAGKAAWDRLQAMLKPGETLSVEDLKHAILGRESKENQRRGQTTRRINQQDKLEQDWTMFRYIAKLAWGKVDAVKIPVEQVLEQMGEDPTGKLKVGMGHGMYAEINRIQRNLSESEFGHPNGEDFMRQKVQQLDDVWAWNEKVEWHYFLADDAKGSPYIDRDRMVRDGAEIVITDENIDQIDAMIEEYGKQSRLAPAGQKKYKNNYLVIKVSPALAGNSDKVVAIREQAQKALQRLGEELDVYFQDNINEAKTAFAEAEKNYQAQNKLQERILLGTGLMAILGTGAGLWLALLLSQPWGWAAVGVALLSYILIYAFMRRVTYTPKPFTAQDVDLGFFQDEIKKDTPMGKALRSLLNIKTGAEGIIGREDMAKALNALLAREDLFDLVKIKDEDLRGEIRRLQLRAKDNKEFGGKLEADDLLMLNRALLQKHFGRGLANSLNRYEQQEEAALKLEKAEAERDKNIDHSRGSRPKDPIRVTIVQDELHEFGGAPGKAHIGPKILFTNDPDNSGRLAQNIAQELERPNQIHVRYLWDQIEEEGWSPEFIASGKKGTAVKGVVRSQVASGMHFIGYTDADTSMTLGTLPSYVLKHVLPGAENVGLVLGSRVGKDSVVYGKPLKRKILSKGFNLLGRMVLVLGGIPDTQCGMKMLKREVGLKIVELSSSKRMEFETELEMLVVLAGYKLAVNEDPWIESKAEATTSAQRDPAEFMLAVMKQYILHVTGHDVLQYPHEMMDKLAKFTLTRLAAFIGGLILARSYPDLTKEFWSLLSPTGRVPEGLGGKLGLLLSFRQGPLFNEEAAVRWVQREMKKQEAWPLKINPFEFDVARIHVPAGKNVISFRDIHRDVNRVLFDQKFMTRATYRILHRRMAALQPAAPAEFLQRLQQEIYRAKLAQVLMNEDVGLTETQAYNMMDIAVKEKMDPKKPAKDFIDIIAKLGQDYKVIAQLGTFPLSDIKGVEVILKRLQKIDPTKRAKTKTTESFVQAAIDTYRAGQKSARIALDYTHKARNQARVEALAKQFAKILEPAEQEQVLLLAERISVLAGLNQLNPADLGHLQNGVGRIQNPGLLLFCLGAVAYLEAPAGQDAVVAQVRAAVAETVLAHPQYGAISAFVSRRFEITGRPGQADFSLRPVQYQPTQFSEGASIGLEDIRGADEAKTSRTIASLLNPLHQGRKKELKPEDKKKAGDNLATVAAALLKGKDARVVKPSLAQRFAENKITAFIGAALIGLAFLVFGVHIASLSLAAIFSITVGWILAFGAKKNKTLAWIIGLAAAAFAFAMTYGGFSHIILSVLQLNLAQVLTGLAMLIFLNIFGVGLGKIAKKFLWNKGLPGKVGTLAMVGVGLYLGFLVFNLLNGGMWFQALAEIGPFFTTLFPGFTAQLGTQSVALFQVGWANIIFGPVIGLFIGLVKLITQKKSPRKKLPFHLRALSIVKQTVLLIFLPAGALVMWLWQMYYRLQGQKQPLRQDFEAWKGSKSLLVDHAALLDENGRLSAQGNEILQAANQRLRSLGYTDVEIKAAEHLGQGQINSAAALFSLEEIQAHAGQGQDLLAAVRVSRRGVQTGLVALASGTGAADADQAVQVPARIADANLARQAAFVADQIASMIGHSSQAIYSAGIVFDTEMDNAERMVFIQRVRDVLISRGLGGVELRWGDNGRLDAQAEIRANEYPRDQVGYLSLEETGLQARLFASQTNDAFFAQARDFLQELKYGPKSGQAAAPAAEQPAVVKPYTPKAFLDQAAVSTAVASFPRFLPVIGRRLGTGLGAKLVTFMIMAPYALYMAIFLRTKKVELMATADQLAVAKWLNLDVVSYQVPFRERTADIHPVMETQHSQPVDVVFHTYEWDKYVAFYMSEKGIPDRAAAEMAVLSQAANNNIHINIKTVFAREEAGSLGLSDSRHMIAENQIARAEELMREKIRRVKELKQRWEQGNLGRRAPVQVAFDTWHISEMYFAELEQDKKQGKNVKAVQEKLHARLQGFFDEAAEVAGRLHISNTPYRLLGAPASLVHGLSAFDRNSIINTHEFLKYADGQRPGIWQNATLAVNQFYALSRQPLPVKILLAVLVPALILGGLVKIGVLGLLAAGIAYGAGALLTAAIGLFRYIFLSQEAGSIRQGTREQETRQSARLAPLQAEYAAAIEQLDSAVESDKVNRENILTSLLLKPSADEAGQQRKTDALLRILRTETRISLLARVLLDMQFPELSWVRSSGYSAAVLERIRQAVYDNPAYQQYLQSQHLEQAQSPGEFQDRFRAAWQERLTRDQQQVQTLAEAVRRLREAGTMENNLRLYNQTVNFAEFLASFDENLFVNNERPEWQRAFESLNLSAQMIIRYHLNGLNADQAGLLAVIADSATVDEYRRRVREYWQSRHQ
ncbi:hypothetical protein JW933_07500, partial [candidate division FCPU426 bacterium]|nr:hypothetical protein [candidate division FCPU426 bacterium]